jgi:hypothetical protein
MLSDLTSSPQLLAILNLCSISVDADTLLIDCPAEKWRDLLSLIDQLTPLSLPHTTVGFLRGNVWQFSYPVWAWL